MRTIDYNTLKKLDVNPIEYYDWVDYVMKNKKDYIMPTKTKIKLTGSDYFNIMPSVLPKENVMGVKLINRNEQRSKNDGLNLDSQILLYSYEDSSFLALLDGNYITTVRTAAVAVHTMLNFVNDFKTISIVGLGNIASSIGDILFEKTKNLNYIVKLYKYKKQEERFIKRFKKYKNITFVLCDTYEDLMRDSDVILSCVTYVDGDFCSPEVYKKGCVILPVHMRGFMECDLCFDHVISSDMERIKEFKYYDKFKRLSSLEDALNNKTDFKLKKDDRVIIYNLGLSIMDVYFSKMYYDKLADKISDSPISPSSKYYM